MSGRTLFDKLWDAHAVDRQGEHVLVYIDRHYVIEVTSAQAYEGLRTAGRCAWRPDSIVAVADHNTPTRDWELGIRDPVSRLQLETLDANIRQFGAAHYFPFKHPQQGIVHVIGPELGTTLPGMTVGCGDSHTTTHGALGTLAFGVGTSEVELVLATQCLLLKPLKAMRVTLDGGMVPGTSANDAALALIGRIGIGGGSGHVIEFDGRAVEEMGMDGRMTLCSMSIEAGARAGTIAVDEKTIEHVRARPYAPRGRLWEQAVEYWRELKSDADARFDTEIQLDVAQLEPQVTWGTSPEMVVPVSGRVPDPADEPNPTRRRAMQLGLEYMGLAPHTRIADIEVDKVFIGSCTNARMEDLRAAADVVRGRKISRSLKQALVVPGSGAVRRAAEAEGLDRVFVDAGFEWRQPGCSMCVGINEDRLSPGERCASTSNRNFEGRQGSGGRTHLVSPAMAAAAALAGRFVDVREAIGR
jgi:3-isopropylmalate/(R)-2-methylmalate dehydratase large subunit